jgi:hypothetical protein
MTAKPNKQTSSAVSSIAAKYVRMKNLDLDILAFDWRTKSKLWRDFRKVCASALAQDQTKGQK